MRRLEKFIRENWHAIAAWCGAVLLVMCIFGTLGGCYG